MTFLLFSQVMRIFEQEFTEQLLNRNFDIFPDKINSFSLWEKGLNQQLRLYEPTK